MAAPTGDTDEAHNQQQNTLQNISDESDILPFLEHYIQFKNQTSLKTTWSGECCGAIQ